MCRLFSFVLFVIAVFFIFFLDELSFFLVDFVALVLPVLFGEAFCRDAHVDKCGAADEDVEDFVDAKVDEWCSRDVFAECFESFAIEVFVQDGFWVETFIVRLDAFLLVLCSIKEVDDCWITGSIVVFEWLFGDFWVVDHDLDGLDHGE